MLWMSAIIQEVWSHWQVVWTQRNHTIHGHDETSRSAALRHDRAEIIMLHEIYSRKDFMKPSDHDKILFEDSEHHLAQSTNQIMNWISVHTPLISHSIKETDKLVASQFLKILLYGCCRYQYNFEFCIPRLSSNQGSAFDVPAEI
jgi:hypothetical protein